MRASEFLCHAAQRDGEVNTHIYFNDLSGASFALDEASHQVMQAVIRHGSLTQAIAAGAASAETAKDVVPHLLQAGILIDEAAGGNDATPRKPLESRLFFPRVHLFSIDAAGDFTRMLSQLLFSRSAGLLYGASLVAAAYLLAGNAAGFAVDVAAAASVTAPDVLLGIAVALVLLKLIHELGHALALAAMLRAEQQAPPLIQFGIATFFLMPFPFTNAGRAWLLGSKWRRMAVGLGGIYLETWVAALAIVAWSIVGSPDVRVFLVQVALVAGVTTVLFNLNPLLRLDGYFVLTDWLDAPNLATRSSQEWSRRLQRCLGVPNIPSDPVSWRTAYGVAAFLQRIVLMAGAVFLALAIDPALALLVALVAASMLFLRPLWSLLKTMRSAVAAGHWAPIWRGATAFAVLVIFPFAPMDRDLVLHGVTVHEDMQTVYPQRAGVLHFRDDDIVEVEADGPASRTVARISSNEDSLLLRKLKAERALAQFHLRRALAEAPDEIAARRQELYAAELRTTTLTDEIAANTVTVGPGQTWIPRRDVSPISSWVAPERRVDLGKILTGKQPLLRFEAADGESEWLNGDLVGRHVPVRIRGANQRNLYARVVSVTQVAQTQGDDAQGPRPNASVRLVAEPLVTVVPDVLSKEGKQVTALVDRPALPVWQHVGRWLEQLLIRRG